MTTLHPRMSAPPGSWRSSRLRRPSVQFAPGSMAATHLFAARELGLLEALADSPATLDALAGQTGLTRRLPIPALFQ